MKLAITPTDTTFDHVLTLARRLRPADQARLIARLAPSIEQILPVPEASEHAARPALRGLFADLGIAPSDSDIADVQHDMWVTFPSDAR